MKNSIKTIVAFSLLSASWQARATVPVIDFSAISQLASEFQQLKNQYALLQRSYQNAEQQLSQAQELTRDSEGHYGFGNLLNGQSDLTNREWSPSSWQSALQGLSGGNAARYQELVDAYKKAHPSLSQTNYEKGASKNAAVTYQQDVQVNRAANVNATYAFNTIKSHLTTIHTLSTQIDQAKNTKAAMDLNARLLAEVAYIQTQELKMQILLNQQLVQTHADDIAAQTENATFNTIPTP